MRKIFSKGIKKQGSVRVNKYHFTETESNENKSFFLQVNATECFGSIYSLFAVNKILGGLYFYDSHSKLLFSNFGKYGKYHLNNI